MPTKSEIVESARGWIGTPFHHQARLKGVGVDCAGLVIGVAKEFGIVSDDFDVQGYDRNPDGETLMQACLGSMMAIDQRDMQPGDVICVRFDRYPQHLGVIGNYRHGGLSIIHASGNAGSVIETRLLFTSMMIFVAAFRMPGVTN